MNKNPDRVKFDALAQVLGPFWKRTRGAWITIAAIWLALWAIRCFL